MSRDSSSHAGSEAGVSIGVAASRLGLTPSTLRSWSTRYAIVPSLRSSGGHRRYSAADLQLLDRVQAQIQAGAAPSAAAAAARGGTVSSTAGTAGTHPVAARAPRRGAGPGGRVVAVPGADAATRGLARAVGQMDLDSAEDIMVSALRERGVVRAWNEMMCPVFVSVGSRWAETGEGVEVEHVLSEAALGALRRRRAELPAAQVGQPVLLASAPDDQHSLSLQALAVGLAERGWSARVMGAQVPLNALANAARRIRPSAIYVNCVVTGAVDAAAVVAALPLTRPSTPVVVGGGGWPRQLPAGLVLATDLGQALDLLSGPARGN